MADVMTTAYRDGNLSPEQVHKVARYFLFVFSNVRTLLCYFFEDNMHIPAEKIKYTYVHIGFWKKMSVLSVLIHVKLGMDTPGTQTTLCTRHRTMAQ